MLIEILKIWSPCTFDLCSIDVLCDIKQTDLNSITEGDDISVLSVAGKVICTLKHT